MKIKDKECHKLKEDMENLGKEYRIFKNATIVEQNRLIRYLEIFLKCVSELKTQQEDTKVCRCNDLAFEIEFKDKEYHQLVGEMEIL